MTRAELIETLTRTVASLGMSFRGEDIAGCRSYTVNALIWKDNGVPVCYDRSICYLVSGEGTADEKAAFYGCNPITDENIRMPLNDQWDTVKASLSITP